MLRAASPGVIETIARGVRKLAPDANVLVAPCEPIVGAALLGLDDLGVDDAATARARAELNAAVLALAPDRGPDAGRHRTTSAAAG
jgi:hypothetical protein